ncbi:MAG TPA: outer membrane beta-barrel protein [Thermoanaerobaculia bacterium]|nr:outer membrane beta-barrel protein [Thermoanaerobaculia bacterium]
MRKALLVMCVLFAVSSFAQDQSKMQLSVFASNPGYVQSSRVGSHYTGGIGAALEYRWNRQWALELQAATQEHGHYEGRTYPVDLLLHYRFENDSRWKPFLGAGFRYENSSFSEFDERSGIEIDGGVHFMLTPSLSLRMDAKQLVLDRNGHFGIDLRPSIGFGWKF